MIGTTPPTPAEAMLRLVQLNLLNSRWALIEPSWWHFDLCSPFWRLYHHHGHGVRITTAGRSVDLAPGDLWLIPAWLEFRAETSAAVRQDFIHFVLSGFPPTLHQRMFPAPILLPRDPALNALGDHWRHGLEHAIRSVSHLEAPDPQAAAVRRTDLRDFSWAGALAQAAVAAALDTLPDPALDACFAWLDGSNGIRPALDAIDLDLANPPANAELARACGVSINQLIRRFHSAIGMTPAQYGLDRRIAVAAQRLIGSDQRIDQVAADLGFTDRYHFSRVFRQRLGSTPAAYRLGHRIGPSAE